MFRLLALSVVMIFSTTLFVSGCSSDSEIEVGVPSHVPAAAPLSLNEWNDIKDHTEKYDVDTLERLRRGDSSLESEKAWEKFMKEVVGPQMAKDKPIKEPI